MRLFAAVLPPPPVLDHLETALTSLRRGPDTHDRRDGLRWTEPADRHLTAAFYGDVPDGYLDDLVEGLAAVAGGVAPFPLTLRGGGVFDRRTVWVGCADPDGGLAGLTRGAVALRRDLLGVEDDRVRSRAHLTVARARPGSRGPSRPRGRARAEAPPSEPEAVAHALAVYEGPTWQVDGVALVASELGAGPHGSPRHEVLHLLPLAADGAVAG